jgi:hypothetical protein
MVPEVATAARRVPEAAWKTFDRESDGTLKQWAELDYVPGLRSEDKHARPRRCIGLRFLKPQGDLFDDGNDRRHFAVATNRAESGEKVVEWHRGKAGTVEHVHDEMKNDLAAARWPSRKFGANAAWSALRVADPERGRPAWGPPPPAGWMENRLLILPFLLRFFPSRSVRTGTCANCTCSQSKCDLPPGGREGAPPVPPRPPWSN